MSFMVVLLLSSVSMLEPHVSYVCIVTLISAGASFLLCLRFYFIPAVRFGRIPKREKQRLLDEMQSYMNSFNQSSPSMDIGSSHSREAPPSPGDSQSEEAIGAISRAYRDIFVNSQDRLAQPRFLQSPSCPQPATHGLLLQGSPPFQREQYPANAWHLATPQDSMSLPFIDNKQYGYPSLIKQPHSLSSADPFPKLPPSTFSRDTVAPHSQHSWSLAAGAKVLVRIRRVSPLSLSASHRLSSLLLLTESPSLPLPSRLSDRHVR